MQNSSEEVTDGSKKLALRHYSQGKDKLKGIKDERGLQEAIEEFEKLFSIISIHRDTTDSPVLTHSKLADAYECCGLAYLTLAYKNNTNDPGSCLKEAIKNFLNAAYYQPKNSDKHKVSTKKWQQIKACCNNCIELYSQGKTQQTKAFFSGLIENCFGQVIYAKASANEVKNAIVDLGCEVDNFNQEILTFYARFYEYRGYSFKRMGEIYETQKRKKSKNEEKFIFYQAKYDLEKSLKIYNALRDFLVTVDHELSIETITEELQDINRRNVRKELSGFGARFFKQFVGVLLFWITTIYGYIQILTAKFFLLWVQSALAELARLLNQILNQKKDKDNS